MSADAVDPAGPPPMTTTSGLRSLISLASGRTDGRQRPPRNHEITKLHQGEILSCVRVFVAWFFLCISNAAVLRPEEIRKKRVDPEQALAGQADHVRRRLGDVAARLARLQLGAEPPEQIDAVFLGEVLRPDR